MNIEGLAIHSLANELNNELSGGRIMRISQPTRFLFVLRIRLAEKEIALAISIDPADPRVHFTRESRENPLEPSSLCMLLRKQLTDGRIAAVTQQAGLDRVLHFDIDLREGQGRIDTKTLTVELAGKNSNLILSNNGLIVDAARRVGFNTSRVRQIVPGIPYLPPPPRNRHDPLQESTEQIVAAIVQQTELALGKALMATVEGIGPLAVSEILFRAGLDAKRPTSSLTVDDLAALTAALASLLAPMHSSPTASFVAMDATNRLLAVANFEPRHLSAACQKNFDSLNQAIEYASSLAAAPKTNLHQDIAKRVRTELDKLERKNLLLDNEWNESQHADDFRQQADLLMTNLHLLKQGMTAIQIADFCSATETNGEAPLEIVLDPALSPMQNIQRYYKKYSRAKRAQELIQIQIEQCRQDILYLEGIALSLTDVITNLEVQEIIQELSESGYMPPTPRSRQNSKPSEPRKIELASGAVILVGRNNRQNDLVTFKHAQPRDLWFHTKDIPGSHVVLRSQGGSPQLPDIEKAAHLAAWFSKARNSANIPVDYTERRYVKKPSGAKPGFVIYEKQKTLRITPTETEINELLQSGIKPSVLR
jgi:predicted ribosome quality control (RQC) complex YloA/Tae2 family protein